MKFTSMQKILFTSLFLIILPLAHQNCGRLTASSGDSSLSSQSLAFYPSVQWDMAKGNDVTVSRLSQVERWTDRTRKSIVLFPPLSSPNVVNMDRAPVISQTTTGSLIAFGENQSLSLQGGDSLTLVASKYTIGLYLRDISPGAGLRVFGLVPSDNSQTGYLGLDIYDLNNGMIRIRGFEFYDGSTYAYADVELPNATLKSGLSIVMRFSEDPTKLRLVVNGQQGAAQIQGSPPYLGNVPRTLTLHGPDTFVGSFSLAGLSIWKDELDDLQIMTLSQSLRSYYESGGTSNIGFEPNPDSGGGGGSSALTFSSVKPNFSSCVNCHDQVASRSQLMATGWVMAGNAAQSKLVKSLRHQSGALPMPRNQAALSETTIQKIESWINQGAQ